MRRIKKNQPQPESQAQPQDHLDYLDGWRGLAIGLLLLGHFFPIPGINLGWVGVNLFFVLSGLLMARLLFIKQTPIPLFYRRRVARIFPVHFLFLVLIIVCYGLFGLTISWSEFAAAALFVNNYFPGEPGNAVMPLGHIWSLSVEEHSYVLLSLIAIASRKGWIKASTAIAIATAIFAAFGIAYSLYFSGSELEFGKRLHTEVSAFGLFLSAYLMLYFDQHAVPRLPVLIYPALLLFGIGFHWWSVSIPLRTIIGVGLFALTVNLLRGAPETVRSALSFRPLRQLGTWSFSIYIWQQPFYLLMHREGMPSVLALGLAIGTGLISFYLIEKPIRIYLNRIWTPAA